MLAVLPLVVAIIVAAFVLSTTAQHRVDRNHAILAAARQEVSELIRLGPTSSQASYDRLLAGSTGSWRDQLARQSDAFTKLAKGNNIQVQGSINAAALQFANDDRARVLIVANSVVKAPSDPSGSTVPYRIAETLELHGDTWLVSELEFVA
jgi:Mce-associated membrane protein